METKKIDFDEEEKKLRQALLKCDLFTFQKAQENYLNFLMPMIKKLASKYAKGGIVSFDDYVNEGYLRASKKLSKFKFSKGVKLVTYMYYEITDAMQNLKCSMEQAYRVPTTNVKILSKINKFLEENPHATYDEIAKGLGLTKKQVMATINVGNPKVSIHKKVNDEDRTTLADTIASESLDPESIVVLAETKQELKELLESVLSQTELTIIKNVFGLGGTVKNLKEIGRDVSLSSERVRQIKEGALNKIRNSSKSQSIISALKTIASLQQ